MKVCVGIRKVNSKMHLVGFFQAFVVALAFLAIVAAEAPRPRAFNQQQVAAPASPPYRPRGFRPSPAFNLPLRSLPQQAYGAPAPSYGPPPQGSYVPPANAEPTTTPVPTTTEYSTEEITTEPQVSDHLSSQL